MARVPYVKRGDLDAEAIGYLASLGTQMRTQSDLPENLKELAIILVAREWNGAIEWTGHAPLAIRAGVSPASVEAIRNRSAPQRLTEPEQIIARFVHQMLRQKEITDEVFAAVESLLGTRGVVDLTFTCIFFTSLSLGQIALKPKLRAGKVSTL